MMDAEAVAAFRERIVAKKFAGLEGLVRARGITVVAGVGAAPHTEIAAAAGLLVEDGIVVDEHHRTSDPEIYAVGDAVVKRDALDGSQTLVPLANTANLQGRRVADHIAGQAGRARPVLGTAIVGAVGAPAQQIHWPDRSREFPAHQ